MANDVDTHGLQGGDGLWVGGRICLAGSGRPNSCFEAGALEMMLKKSCSHR